MLLQIRQAFGFKRNDTKRDSLVIKQEKIYYKIDQVLEYKTSCNNNIAN